MNSILEKALKSLSITCNLTALHPSDEDSIKITFKTLHKNGVLLEAGEIENWLVQNNWQASPIKSAISWVQAISSGGRVQIKHKSNAPTEKEVWSRLNA